MEFNEEEAFKDFLEEARDPKRQKGFEIMRRNVLAHPMDPDTYLKFLTQLNRYFDQHRAGPPRHDPPVDNGKFLI